MGKQLLLIMIGDSNSASYVPNSQIPTENQANELGVRDSIKIVNNLTLTIETLSIGVNNQLDEYNPLSVPAHGWELQLGNIGEVGGFSEYNDLYLVKAGQGGAKIRQFLPTSLGLDGTTSSNFWNKFVNRYNVAKNDMQGDTPDVFILFSQGISDALAWIGGYGDDVSPSVWKTEVQDFIGRIRALVGYSCPILMTKFDSYYDSFLNNGIDNIVAETPNVEAISAVGLTKYDSWHWDYASTKILASRFVEVINRYINNQVSKSVFVSAKYEDSCGQGKSCEFGYSTSRLVNPSVWYDYTQLKRLIITNGVVTEVSSGGELYQTKSFNLTVGTYYFFVREKNNSTGEITYMGLLNVSDSPTIESGTNIVKTIAPLANGQLELPLSNFVKQGQLDTLFYIDSEGIERDCWGVWWQAANVGFDSQGIKPWQVNLGGCTEYVEHFGGFMERGLEYVLTYNPDNGNEFWEKDPQTLITYPPSGKTYNEFLSTVNPRHRLESSLNLTSRPPWDTLLDWYNAGQGGGSSHAYGHGDDIVINGKTKAQRGLFAFDFEWFEYSNEENIALMIGVADGSTALISNIYAPPFNWYGKSQNYTINGLEGKMDFLYPDRGNYLASNKIDRNQIWHDTNPTRITIPNTTVVNKGLSDYPSILPTGETSSMESWFRPQGSTNQKEDGSNYVVNKFGDMSTWTDVSPMFHIGTLLETWSWYSMNKLNKRFIAMAKVISDKGDLGSNLPGRSNTIQNRKWGFLIGLLTYMNGCHWFIWGEYSNNNTSQDGYVGSLGMLRIVRDSGGLARFQEMVPVFWETEYSLDNGTTWKKSKAQSWADSLTTELPVRVKMSDTHYEIAAFRGEGLEPLNFKVRIVKGSTVIEKTVTSDMWDTVSYEHRNTPLSDIPNEHKHYYYDIFSF